MKPQSPCTVGDVGAGRDQLISYDANGEWRLDGTSWHVMMPLLCVKAGRDQLARYDALRSQRVTQ